MGPVLGPGHAAVADLQHVRVVERPGLGVVRQALVGLRDGDHALPVVADVTGGAPGVADRLRPVPRPGAAPLADAVEDRAAGLLQGVAHGLVPGPGVDALVVAVVVLEVVDAPGRPQVGVLLLVAEPAGEALDVTGVVAGAGVDAELQALAVHVVGEGLDAVREADRVGHQVAARVALGLGPAVVEVDVLVAGRLEALGDEDVGDALDHRLVELGPAVGGVPVVEAHLRRQVEAVVEGRGRRCGRELEPHRHGAAAGEQG